MKIIGIDARFMLRSLRGISLYVLRICENLPKDKEKQFIYFINKGFEHNDTPENYFLRIESIEKKHSNVKFINYESEAEGTWEQVHLPRLAKKHKIDLLHLPANRNCYFPGVPTVVTVHDMMEYLHLLDQKFPISWEKNKSLRMLQYNLRRRAYVVAMYRFGIKRASKVITVSDSSANDIKKHLGLSADKVSVIHHGVDAEYLGKAANPSGDRSHTLLLGGDSYQKNPSGAVAAWAMVDPTLRKKHPLKIVGFCGNDTSPLRQALKNHGLEEEVEVTGWISQEEMVENFRNAALFLFPSRYEGFGFPLIQAMASGTPVIATDKSSIPEVLGSVGFKYDPDDHVSMAAGIDNVLSNVTVWNQQSESGLLRAQGFAWENSAKAHLDVYARLLGKSGE